jgi:hypothetical protein
MREQLSSRMTFFLRSVFPPVWSALFGLAVLLVWTVGPRPGHSAPLPLGMKLLFTSVWAAGSAFLFLAMRGLRTVWLENDHLVVSAGGEEWLIPLAAVERLDDSRFSNPRKITIHARGPTGELVKVRFMAPQVLMLPAWKPHPMAAMLRERIDSARALGVGSNVR